MNIQDRMNKKSAGPAQPFSPACVYILGHLKKEILNFL